MVLDVMRCLMVSDVILCFVDILFRRALTTI